MSLAYEIQDLTFGYHDTPTIALKRLEVRAGEILGLAGPNGSGKTTLLHLMAFINEPWSGTIRFFDEDSRDLNSIDLRRKVGLLLQHPYMFSTTVLGNITWGLRIRGTPRERGVERAREALEWVGLAGFEKREARSLSGGEIQRVALARSLVLDPEVLLLDEHANHMDKQSVERVEQVVMERNGAFNNTVIFAGHFLDRKTSLEPDRIIHIDRIMKREIL
jgi:tungstate transport system ATP-binding protein